MRVAIVQARMGSSRLPGKVLTRIGAKVLIDHVLDRVAAARRVEHTVVATTRERSDDTLVAHLLARGDTTVYRGDTDDVLARYHEAARQSGASVVVRVTADNPFKDPGIIDRALGLLDDEPRADYVSNTVVPTYPEGFDIEVVTVEALETAYREARLPSEREHVTPFIWKRPERFRVRDFRHHEDLSGWRCTVDHEADLRFAEALLERLGPGGEMASFERIAETLAAHPNLVRLNRGIARNEGYDRSIRDEEHAG